MTTRRRWFVATTVLAGLLVGVPLLSAFQGSAPSSPDLGKLFAEVIGGGGGGFFFIVKGIQALRQLGLGGGAPNEAYLEKREVMAIGIRQEDIAKSVASTAASNDKIVRALEHLTDSLPSIVDVIRSELNTHEKAALGRSIACEDAATQRHEELRHMLGAVRDQRAIEGPAR